MIRTRLHLIRLHLIKCNLFASMFHGTFSQFLQYDKFYLKSERIERNNISSVSSYLPTSVTNFHTLNYNNNLINNKLVF